MLKKNAERYYVYTLTDPFSREIKYVGVTTNCKLRVQTHFRMRNFQFAPVNDWIAMLGFKRARPIFDVVAEFDNYNSAISMEAHLINSMGSTLLNVEHNPNRHKNHNRHE